MTQGGTHPQGKTTVSVSPFRSSFNESIADLAALFYSVNVGCLTPSSDFRVLRECTLLFATTKAEKKTVRDAWNAVGVIPPVVTSMTFNEPKVGLSGALGEYYFFKLEGAEAGEAITCTTQCSTGDADLFVRFGQLPDPFYFAQVNDCMSGEEGSNERCTTDLMQSPTTVYAAINAFDSFTDLSITCFREVVTTLSNGISLAGQSGSASSVKYFIMNGVETGSKFNCETTGSNGDADLFLRIGTLPEPFGDGTNDCESTSKGKSNEKCAGMNGSLSSTQVFLALYAKEAYTDLTVRCQWLELTEAAKALSDGQPLTGQSAVANKVTQYIMSGVKAGDAVNCSLSDGQGDANVYVQFGKKPNPSAAASNACWSENSGTQEACLTTSAPKDTKAYVAVSTVTGYSGLTVACRRQWKCYARNQECRKTSECCSDGTLKLTCTGPTKSSRVCKVCRAATQSCTRDSDCCSALSCKKGKCQKQSGGGGGGGGTGSGGGGSGNGGGGSGNGGGGSGNGGGGTGNGGGGGGGGSGGGSGTGKGGGSSGSQGTVVGLVLYPHTHRCKAEGKKCSRRLDCCSYGKTPKTLTCDGPVRTRKICKQCRRQNTQCTRKTQCCKGLTCLNGKCRP